MNKKTESKKTAPENWHRADIVAALHKAGWSLRKLAGHHEYASPTTLSIALDRPWPKGERLIAAAIGVDPSTIWPTRYTSNYPCTASKNSTLQGVLDTQPRHCKSNAA